jgi:hypothetical protein
LDGRNGGEPITFEVKADRERSTPLYGPTETAIDKSWKPGDIEKAQ